MQFRQIENVSKPVSRILFGTTNLVDYDEKSAQMLDEVFKLGVTSFDCARVYSDGKAEAVMGQWLEEKKNREKVVILSKGAHPNLSDWIPRVSKAHIEDDLKASLEALRTDYIDIYLLHRDDPEVEVGPIVESLHALYEEGKIKAYGGSNWTMERIIKANEYADKYGLKPFTVSSPHFGIAEQQFDLWYKGVTITGDENKASRDWYESNQMPVVAYSSLGCGIFSGKIKSTEPEKAKELFWENVVKAYVNDRNMTRLSRCEKLAAEKNCSVSQIAMAWLLNQKINTFAVVSSNSLSRMIENINAVDIKLTAEELDFLSV